MSRIFFFKKTCPISLFPARETEWSSLRSSNKEHTLVLIPKLNWMRELWPFSDTLPLIDPVCSSFSRQRCYTPARCWLCSTAEDALPAQSRPEHNAEVCSWPFHMEADKVLRGLITATAVTWARKFVWPQRQRLVLTAHPNHPVISARLLLVCSDRNSRVRPSSGTSPAGPSSWRGSWEGEPLTKVVSW